jgi:cobalt-zinc-cadmium efflux system outer membrane protein
MFTTPENAFTHVPRAVSFIVHVNPIVSLKRSSHRAIVTLLRTIFRYKHARRLRVARNAFNYLLPFSGSYNLFTGFMRLSAFILLAAISACAQSSLDLKQALQIADADNLELRAARQQRAIAIAGLKTAGQIPNPIISFGAARDVPHESLLWDQSIEVGGQRGKRLAVARAEQKATDIDIAVLARQIRRRTRETFYQVLAAQGLAEQAKNALDLTTRIRDTVEQRFEAGDVAQLEVIQAEVEMQRASAEYEAARETEKSFEAALSGLLTRSLEQELHLAGNLSDMPAAPLLHALTEDALRSNADLQRTTQEVETEQRRLALAKAARIPNVDIQVGTDFNSPPDFNVGPRAQIGVALPLFYHGQGEVAASNARLSFLQLSLQAQKNTTSVLVVGAYYDFVAKAQLAARYKDKIVPETERLETMAEDSYRSGKSNLLTLIDAQRRLNDTHKEYLDSLMAAQSSFAALEETVGIPLD